MCETTNVQADSKSKIINCIHFTAPQFFPLPWREDTYQKQVFF